MELWKIAKKPLEITNLQKNCLYLLPDTCCLQFGFVMFSTPKPGPIQFFSPPYFVEKNYKIDHLINICSQQRIVAAGQEKETHPRHS